jgi:hypothetical protein
MGFWGSLFGGSNSTLSGQLPKLGNIADTQSGQGQKNENTASSFWDSILSDDSSKQMQALGGKVGAAKSRANQDIKTNSLFGTRSGGTAASNTSSTDKVHSDITSLIGSLTGNSASSLATLGSGQIGTGLGAYQQQLEASQQQMQNWADSIGGRALTQGSATLTTMATSV